MPRSVTLIFFLAMLATESRANGVMYYVTDWQGNNVAVEPTGQRYLFAGKEREHAGGRNTYDFGARSLTPYGRWGVVDQLAEKFYPFSSYSYCGGDPINYIDTDGREKICLTRDLLVYLCMVTYKDNGTQLHIFTHGTPESLTCCFNEDGKIINSGDFVDAIKMTSEKGELERYYGAEIVLHACNTGRTLQGKESIAQKLSKDLRNVIITAPDASVSFLSSGKEELFRKTNDNSRIYSKEYKWHSFFRGVEISSDSIAYIKLLLFFQKNQIFNKAIEYLLYLSLPNGTYWEIAPMRISLNDE